MRVSREDLIEAEAICKEAEAIGKRTAYRSMLHYLGFDLILLGIFLGMPRLAGKPLWMSWLDIILSLVMVWTFCMCAHTLTYHGRISHRFWPAACIALPIILSLGLYYWYTEIETWKGAGIGPGHTGSLIEMALMIWMVVIVRVMLRQRSRERAKLNL
jgi:hypothetical protein